MTKTNHIDYKISKFLSLNMKKQTGKGLLPEIKKA